MREDNLKFKSLWGLFIYKIFSRGLNNQSPPDSLPFFNFYSRRLLFSPSLKQKNIVTVSKFFSYCMFNHAEYINKHMYLLMQATLSKFVQIAKICKDLRNYASCIAIKDGLDHIMIRHIPVSEMSTKPHQLTYCNILCLLVFYLFLFMSSKICPE